MMRYEEQIKSNFVDHIADYSKYVKLDGNNNVVDEIEVLRWKKPGSSIYSQTYIKQGYSLFVKGDMGEAVYCWSESQTLQWIAKLDLSYFASKCVASECGSRFEEWNPDVAEEEIKSYLYTVVRDSEEESKIMDALQEKGGMSALAYEEEWQMWLHEYGYDVFGDEFYEWAPSVGKSLSIRCESHFLGLKMAMDQLNVKKTIEVS